MTERQGVGILYNIPHLAESFITHCLLYRFTQHTPGTMTTTPKSSTFLRFPLFFESFLIHCIFCFFCLSLTVPYNIAD